MPRFFHDIGGPTECEFAKGRCCGVVCVLWCVSAERRRSGSRIATVRPLSPAPCFARGPRTASSGSAFGQEPTLQRADAPLHRTTKQKNTIQLGKVQSMYSMRRSHFVVQRPFRRWNLCSKTIRTVRAGQWQGACCGVSLGIRASLAERSPQAVPVQGHGEAALLSPHSRPSGPGISGVEGPPSVEEQDVDHSKLEHRADVLEMLCRGGNNTQDRSIVAGRDAAHVRLEPEFSEWAAAADQDVDYRYQEQRADVLGVSDAGDTYTRDPSTMAVWNAAHPEPRVIPSVALAEFQATDVRQPKAVTLEVVRHQIAEWFRTGMVHPVDPITDLAARMADCSSCGRLQYWFVTVDPT